MVRANLSKVSGEETITQNKYDNLYYSLDSEGETEQDFREPLWNYASDCLCIASCDTENSPEMPSEAQCILDLKIESMNHPRNKTHSDTLSFIAKPPLNRTAR